MIRTDDKTTDRCINALRFLACDAIEKAHSGHPGLPLGAAPAAFTLWTRHLRYDPTDPSWADRDRFVLSAGHGSALLYALLHLTGYDVPLSELESFRQWESLTPGHPESHVTPGVEVTTGPLGQGLANAVGLAVAEAHLAATFNRPGHSIVDHTTYVIVGDGDLMEGVAYEACALAGHLKLGKLIVLFDSNRISLAGSSSLATSEDIVARFVAAGWQPVTVGDGNDVDAIDRAIDSARTETDKPSLVVLPTVIGFGSPKKQNTFGAHGAPLGPDELAAAKRALDWPVDPPFHIPDDVRSFFDRLRQQVARPHDEWRSRFDAFRREHPALASEFERRVAGKLPTDWATFIPSFKPHPKGMATRKASEAVLQAVAPHVPELIGGSADLNPSTFTWLKGYGDLQAPGERPDDVQGAVGDAWDYSGRNVHFGVREHAMGAIVNGIAQHGALIPYSATFLVFADYMRPPIRLAALSRYPSIFVFTHDSIGVGEDGPTHQPVEQMMSLRLIPDLVVLRPADANETVVAWRIAIERRDGPTVLIFSRQALPTFDRAHVAPADGVRRGGYVLWESSPAPQLVLIATGSEVQLALAAARRLAERGHAVRVVSFPSWELFEEQNDAYRRSVLPDGIDRRIAIEAGRGLGWERYIGSRGRILSVDRFGASAPGSELFRRFGLTAEAIIETAEELLAS